VRMEKVTGFLLEDIDQDTVDFQPNYDNLDSEPKVLPARFPNLLVNGTAGIAVGMATNIPPHNLGEIIDATLAIMDDPEISFEELMAIVPGPDFPTGALILGRAGARSAYATGRGSVIMRARTVIEQRPKDREAIIVTEVPYQVNKAGLVEKIADLVREKRIEGITDLRDESNRHGVRVVIEIRRDAVADVVLNQLHKFTPMQTSFGVNILALNGGRPEQLDLRRLLDAFIAFREEVVARRTRYRLGEARNRAHVLVGLAIAVANVDEVIKLIRSSPDPATARTRLLERSWPAKDMAPFIQLIDDPHSRLLEGNSYNLTDIQARAILDLRLQRLTALGADEIGNELKTLGDKISDFLDILGSRARIMTIIREEMVEVRDAFATPRRSEILDIEADVDDEALIAREDMVITVTHAGYIKRVALDTYRSQRRGGKGRSGMATKDEDFVTKIFIANTHTPVLFFSNTGIAYKLKVWRLPAATPQSRGKAMVNLLPLEADERIATVLPVDRDEDDWDSLHVVFATSRGNVRRNALSDFTNVRSNGKIAMKLDEGEELIAVRICDENDDCLLNTHMGKAIRFPVTDLRVFKSRDSTGVRGIRLAKGDRVISASILRHMEVTPAEAREYLRLSSANRRAITGEEDDGAAPEVEFETDGGAEALTPERYATLGAAEQFLLTLSEDGFGYRTSAYWYRTMGRGGQGVAAIDLSKRKWGVAAAFPVEDSDHIVIVTDGGQLIRTRVDGISIQSRGTAGVTIFRTAKDEKVMSVAHLADAGDDDEEEGDEPDEDAGQNDDGDSPDAPPPDDGDTG